MGDFTVFLILNSNKLIITINLKPPRMHSKLKLFNLTKTMKYKRNRRYSMSF